MPLREGIIMAAQNGYFRQAVATFARSGTGPDNLAARLWLGQIYVLAHLPDRALEALRDPLEQPEKFSLAKHNATELSVIAARRLFSENDSPGRRICSKPKSPSIPTTPICSTPPCRPI